MFDTPDNSSSALIDLSQVSKTYRSTAGSFTALKNINLKFFPGEFVGVIGKSGSGKSTLANMITGIDRPSKGKVHVDGLDIHAMKESQQARWRGLNMGVVFQFFQLLPMLTLAENVLLPMDFCNKYPPEQRYDRAMELLAMVGLEGESHKLPNAVSGGQQQSAAIARAMANDPPILIADEPTGNLDAKTANSVYDKFEALSGEGRTIIMITHDPEIEHRLSRIVHLSDGEIVDPLLTKMIPWLPNPLLRQLGHHLVRRRYHQGESLAVTGQLSNTLIMIESGKVQLDFSQKPYHSKTLILAPGQYLSGKALVEGEKWGDFRAQVISGSAKVALLDADILLNTLAETSDGLSRFKSHLHNQMLGVTDEGESGGLIQ
jgi:putative ABC transport system ATP-binding protein